MTARDGRTAALLSAMQEYFGHSAFRPGQQALAEALLSGRDVLGVMPTGAGKSMCYQLPALRLPGTALVISPLISLMKDQVAALAAAGIPAAFLNSTLDADEYRRVLRGAAAGEYRLLYIAPERLEAEAFRRLAARLDLSLVAVDEAHCVSQWGQDFRPSYLKIAAFLRELPRRPAVGAFTATATAQVREDIVRLLDLRDPLCVATGFDRPNLCFRVLRPAQKLPCLMELLQSYQARSGIVYCATRAAVEQVCEALRAAGFAAVRYHAGLPDAERRQNQEDFVYDRAQIMVATNAFGMGIDKSNVGFVIHYNMPKDLESYYQEAGRAGRDGSPADCVLLYAPRDVQTAEYLIRHSEENELPDDAARAERLRLDLARLDRMAAYCKTTACLRAALLRYFGEEAPDTCGNCGSCLSTAGETDITTEAQKILSCAVRVRRQLGYDVGLQLILQVLLGSRSQRIRQLRLDKLSTYGLLAGTPKETVQRWAERLMELGYLAQQRRSGFSVVVVTEAAGDVLFRGARVTAPAPEQPAAAAKPLPAADPAAGPAPEDLTEALRALRTRLAQAAAMPAYIIFSNATLEALARLRPADREALLAVPGIGEAKAGRYGDDILEVIRRWEEHT